MKATVAVLDEIGVPFALREVDLDEPRSDELLIRIEAAGICHTDLAVQSGDFPLQLPMVLGHEGAGVVEAVGEGVTKVGVGDRVALTPVSCGMCGSCLDGEMVYCNAFMGLNFGGTRADGTFTHHYGPTPIAASFVGQSSFGTHAIASQRSVVKLPEDFPSILAGPLSCGFQTGAGTVMNVLKARPGSTIAIFGSGPVGIAAAMAARAVGCTTVIVVEPRSSRRTIALELGATHAIDPDDSVTDVLLEITQGVGVQHAIDTTGSPVVAGSAVQALAQTGECVLLGVSPPGAVLSVDMFSLAFGRSIRGSMLGDSVPEAFMPVLISLWRDGRFPIDRLVTTFPLADINAAVGASASGEVMKAVLIPE